MAADKRIPVEPLPSATVVLVRAAPHSSELPPELLLVRRPAGVSFGASYVFPGGLLEADDGRAHSFSRELPAAAANRSLKVAEGGLDYYSAAIRELFEETGVLLARERLGGRYPPTGTNGDPGLAAARARIHAHELRWHEFLEQRDLVLACDTLLYFAHWITPRTLPRRYSTRFFLATLPDGQEARHDGVELTDSRWTTAAAALKACRSGEFVLPPPTLQTLNDIAAYRSVEELCRFARERCDEGVTCIVPAIVSSGGRERIVMPWHDDYAQHAGGD